MTRSSDGFRAKPSQLTLWPGAGGGLLRSSSEWLPAIFRWFGFSLKLLLWLLLIVWGSLAIYYSNLPWAELRLVIATLFAGFSVWVLWLSRLKHATAVLMTAFLAVCFGWILIPASHDRPWRPEVAVMPRATIDGDRISISGVRNFSYRSRNGFTPTL